MSPYMKTVVSCTTNRSNINVIIVDKVCAHFVLGVEIMTIIHFANTVLLHTTTRKTMKSQKSIRDIAPKREAIVKAFQVIIELSQNLKITIVQEDNQPNQEAEDHHQLLTDSIATQEVTKDLN